MIDDRLDLAVNNAQIVNAGGTVLGSIGVRQGKIAALSVHPLRAIREIDAASKPVIPGVVDAHCHFRIIQGSGPKAISSSDDYLVGPRAAAFGGVTTYIDFAIQERGRSAFDLAQSRIAEASRSSIIDFAFHASLTDSRHEVLEEIGPLMDAGIASFKFFTAYAKWGFYVDLGFLHEAMARIAARGGTIAIHAENDEILEFWRERKAKEDPDDMMNHTLSRPAIAEEIAIHDVAALARDTGASVYIVHLSSGRGLKAVTDERLSGARLYAETCPHYLAFTSDAYSGSNSRYYTMTPPLRSDGNRQALWAAVADGRIDTLASDHNSFTRKQKEAATGFLDVPPGVSGTEMLLPFVLSEGVNAGRISLEHAVALLCHRPAKIFHLPTKGAIEVGKDADMVVLDLDQERDVTDSTLHDPNAYTLFAGMRMRGWPTITISRGEVIVADGETTAKPGRGKFIARFPTPQSKAK